MLWVNIFFPQYFSSSEWEFPSCAQPLAKRTKSRREHLEVFRESGLDAALNSGRK